MYILDIEAHFFKSHKENIGSIIVLLQQPVTIVLKF